jgi:MFS family permease
MGAQQIARSAKVPATSWYALAVLTAIQIFAYMDRVALSILMQPIKLELRLSDGQLGLVTGIAFALFYAIMGVPLAWLADRKSRVKVIAACLALWSVATSLSGMARNFPQLFLARIGVGIGEAGCVPPSHSLIGDYFPREKRALGISLYAAGAAVGVAGGMIVIGLLGEKLGWRYSLQAIGIMGLPLALLTILTLREPQRPKSDAIVKESPRQSIVALLRRPAFVHLAIGFAVAHVCTDGSAQWFPAFMMRSFDMRMAEVGVWVGTITAGFGVLGVISGGMLASWLLQRDPRWEQWIPTVAAALCVPFFILMVLSKNVVVALSMRALMTLFNAAGQSVATAAVQSFAEPHRRATAVSLVCGGGGPYLIGLTSDLLEPALGEESLRYAMLVSCVMLVWATAHFGLASRNALKDRVN